MNGKKAPIRQNSGYPKKRVGNAPNRNAGNGRKPQVDWGNEVSNSLGLIGRVFLRILSYIVNILLTLMLVGLITGTVVGCTLLYYINNYIDADISDFDYITTSSSTTSKFYYMDWTDRENRIGTPVEMKDQQLHGTKNQTSVPYAKLPDYLWKAFVAYEDKRFFEHNGVDIIPTMKAAVNYVLSGGGGGVAGGSTITQQLVKNITGDDEVTIQRKIQEALRAFKVEEKYDKTEILEMYLNRIYLSQGCYGVQAAAYKYFGKDVSDLTLIECVSLACITQFPTKYDPIQNPENNAERRDIILKLMLEQGCITQSEFNSAYGKELVINKDGENNITETGETIEKSDYMSWYLEAAQDECIDLFVEHLGVSRENASQMIYSGGYQVYTAIDNDIQSILEDYYENPENFMSVDDSPIQPESAIVIIDPYTGDVLGIIGQRGEKQGDNWLNYATETVRSPGSSIKPLSVYAPALEAGLITYGSVFDDTPVNFGEAEYSSAGVYLGYSKPKGYPQNYSNTYRGLTTINYAVTNSLNTISMKVLQKLTLASAFDFVKNKLHMDSFIEYKEYVGGATVTDMDYSALALGGMNEGVTVLEMTAAYQIFVNHGVYNKPRFVLKILDSEGNVIINNESESTIVISDQNASIMTKLMQNVVTSGTAKSITLDDTLGIDVAGKTGTTTQDNDRWFMGYTPYYVAGVWFGYSMPKSLSKFSASQSPAVKIWDDIMTILHRRVLEQDKSSGFGVKSFVTAEGVVTATYCMDSGKLITEACKNDPRGSRAEMGYFTQSTVPTESCDCHTLVAFDKSTAGAALVGCPTENIKYYGLLKITNRSFPYNIAVTDAQYVARDLPSTIEPGRTLFEPYFINTISKDTYIGITGSSETTQFNHACIDHYGLSVEEPEESGYEDEEGDIADTEEENDGDVLNPHFVP